MAAASSTRRIGVLRTTDDTLEANAREDSVSLTWSGCGARLQNMSALESPPRESCTQEAHRVPQGTRRQVCVPMTTVPMHAHLNTSSRSVRRWQGTQRAGVCNNVCTQTCLHVSPWRQALASGEVCGRRNGSERVVRTLWRPRGRCKQTPGAALAGRNAALLTASGTEFAVQPTFEVCVHQARHDGVQAGRGGPGGAW